MNQCGNISLRLEERAENLELELKSPEEANLLERQQSLDGPNLKSKYYLYPKGHKPCENCGKPLPALRKRFCSKSCYYHATPLQRLLVKCRKDEITGCWNWFKGLMKDGYGGFGMIDPELNRYRTMGSHRASWLLHNGRIPTGMMVCHHCDNRLCVNPAHLFIGTAADNNKDMMKKGRHYFPLGEDAVNAKLTTAQVIEIRSRHSAGGITQRKLAAEYGIGFKAINKIIKRQRWKHV